MLVRIREPDPQERWLMRCEIMWQPLNGKKWYPVHYGNIAHEDPEARRNALNALHIGHITVVCRARYDRTSRTLTILSPKRQPN